MNSGLSQIDSSGADHLDQYSRVGAGGTFPWTDVDAGYRFIAGNRYTGASA